MSLRRPLVLLALAGVAAWAPRAEAAPVRLTVHGPGIPADEPLLVHLTSSSGEVETATLNDAGSGADESAGDAVWSGTADVVDLHVDVTFEAGSRTFPTTSVTWIDGPGTRWANFDIHGSSVDATSGIRAPKAAAVAVTTTERPWEKGAFAVVGLLAFGLVLAERWGRGRPPVGQWRLPAPPPFAADRLPRGAVRVADPAVLAPLLAALARTHTVVFVGPDAPPRVPGRVRRLTRAEPERLAGAVTACGAGAVAVVVVGADDEVEDWAAAAAGLRADVPVFVLVPAGEAPAELVTEGGSVRWAG